MPVKKTLPVTEEKKSGYQDYRCFVTFHPRSVLEGGFQLEDRIVEDFRRLAGESLSAPANECPKAVAGAVVGFDTEYSNTASLLTIGIAEGSCAVAYEVSDKKGIAQASKVIRGAGTIVGHSVPGDLDYLVRLGLAKEDWLRGENIRDSFLLARMSDENRGKGAYGLEVLMLSEKNFSEWKSETAALLKKTGNASDWTPAQRVERCRLDAWATMVLAEHFEGKINGTVESIEPES